MESPECIPSLNLEGIASDRMAGKEGSPGRGRGRGRGSETETQTDGAGVEAPRSETGNSKSSSEPFDASKEDGNNLSGSSSSSLSSSLPAAAQAKMERKLRGHQTERIKKNPGPSPVQDSIRSSAPEIIALPDHPDLHLTEAREESTLAENERLREVLTRERRHHARERNRMRQVLWAIDEALSTLPSRLGKIRLQNRKNLMKMNAIEFRDRGDFEVAATGASPEEPERSFRFSDICSEVSHATNLSLFRKIESLNDLIESMKTGNSAPIEDVLDNELCAISLLKNEIRHTRRKIEGRGMDVLGDGGALGIDAMDLRKLEKYIMMQKEAMNVLSIEARKAKESYYKEMKEKEKAQTERKALLLEIAKLKKRDDCQRSRARSGDARPFRMIKELKAQIEEKDKALNVLKSKISRLEAAGVNKGTLLDNEKKKTEELEAKLKILSSENKSFSKQMTSLQYINKELKEQMDVLKNQIEILIKQNEELPTKEPCDLTKHFTEIIEMLKNEDNRVKTFQEEAEKKMKDMEKEHLKDVNDMRIALEKSERINVEHMRTLKGLILCFHNFHIDNSINNKKSVLYERCKEILGITDNELENLIHGNLKDTHEKELEDLYYHCYTLVNEDEECEFSMKLSSWLFDLAKNKMNPNFNISFD